MLPRGTPSGSTGRAGTNKGCHFGCALKSQSSEARIGWIGRPVREPRERGLVCAAVAPRFAICSPIVFSLSLAEKSMEKSWNEALERGCFGAILQ